FAGPCAPDALTSRASVFSHDFKSCERLPKLATSSICGICPWAVEYISLRALGNADAFPAADLILKRALGGFPCQTRRRVASRSHCRAVLPAHWAAVADPARRRHADRGQLRPAEPRSLMSYTAGWTARLNWVL